MRRKGERKVVKTWRPYAVDAIRHMIATGTPWFQAWIMQACTPLAALSRKSKIEPDRIDEILTGWPLKRDELIVLAAVWNVDPDIVISTMPDPALLTE